MSTVKFFTCGAIALLGLVGGSGSAVAGIKIGVAVVDGPRGVVVDSTTANGTARQKMKMRAGDVLLTVNGKKVTSANQFAAELRRSNTIRVSWVRGGIVHRGWASNRVVTGGGEEVVVGGQGDPDDK